MAAACLRKYANPPGITLQEGIGIGEILNAIVERIPPPSDTAETPLRALIFDRSDLLTISLQQKNMFYKRTLAFNLCCHSNFYRRCWPLETVFIGLLYHSAVTMIHTVVSLCISEL